MSCMRHFYFVQRKHWINQKIMQLTFGGCCLLRAVRRHRRDERWREIILLPRMHSISWRQYCFHLHSLLVLPLLHLHFYNFARKDERGEFSLLRVNSKRLIIAFSRQAVQTLCLELATQDTDILDKARSIRVKIAIFHSYKWKLF